MDLVLGGTQRSNLLGNRLKLDLYANVRPVKLYEGVKARISGKHKQVWEPGEVDMVFLCNVPAPTQDAVQKLEQFVAGGGGLAVFVGNQVDTKRYNEILYRDGQGLLPAPLTELAGDLCDYAVAGPGQVAVLVADVVGHGASAAMLTALVKSAFHAAQTESYDPAVVVKRVSEGLATFDAGRFVTLLAARLDLGNGTL